VRPGGTVPIPWRRNDSNAVPSGLSSIFWRARPARRERTTGSFATNAQDPVCGKSVLPRAKQLSAKIGQLKTDRTHRDYLLAFPRSE